MQNDTIWQRFKYPGGAHAFFLIGIAGIALAIRLFGLGSQSLWFDETYTVFVAKIPLLDGWKFLVADGVHPPLFYWIERVFLFLGDSETFVRLPALIFGVLAVPALYLIGKKWVTEGQALFASSLLAISPFHIWYSQEARMYTGLLLSAILILGIFYDLTRRATWGKRITFIILSALAYLLHYFALFIPLIEFIYLVADIRRNPRLIREWTVMQAIAALPILAWIVVLANRSGQFFGIGWIPQTQWKDLLLTILNFTVGLPARLDEYSWAALFVICGFLLRAMLMRWSNPMDKLLISLWAFLPIVLVFLFSFRRPVYVDRFLIFCLPAFLLLLSKGISGLGKKPAVASALLLITMFGIGFYNLYQTPEGGTKENWREALTLLESEAGPDDLIVLRVLQIAVPMSFYYSGDSPVQALEVNRQMNSLKDISLGYAGVWLVYWNASANTHALAPHTNFDLKAEKDEITSAWINGNGPLLEERIDFPGVTIFHFDQHPLAQSLSGSQ